VNVPKHHRVTGATRCYVCGLRLTLTDLDDPDDVIDMHIRRTHLRVIKALIQMFR
jgi:hypothetical protein